MKEKGGKERKKNEVCMRERERESYVRSYQVGLTLF